MAMDETGSAGHDALRCHAPLRCRARSQTSALRVIQRSNHPRLRAESTDTLRLHCPRAVLSEPRLRRAARQPEPGCQGGAAGTFGSPGCPVLLAVSTGPWKGSKDHQAHQGRGHTWSLHPTGPHCPADPGRTG